MSTVRRLLQKLAPLLRTSLVLVFFSMFAGACASPRSSDNIERLLGRAHAAAETKHATGMDPEAAVISHAMAAVDPEFPDLDALRDSLDARALARIDRGWLGINRKLRREASPSIAERVLWYLPDRVLDVADIFSIGVMWGPGIYVDSHVTRAVQVTAGGRATAGIGWHDHRSLGIKSQADAGVTLIGVGAQSHVGALVGTSGARGAAADLVGIHRPSDALYQELRDYWAIGAGTTIGLMGVEVDVHPIQIADLVVGFIGIDFLNDDFATTSRLRLDADDRSLLRQLWTVRASSGTLERYREAKRATPGPAHTPSETLAAPAKRPTPETPLPAAPAPD